MEFLTVADPQWQSILGEVPHDVYHTPAYLAHAARHEGGEPVALVLGDRDTAWFVPLLLRPLPPELQAPAAWLDASTPYGYGGPLLCTPGQTPDWNGFSAMLRAAARRCQMVTMFLRWHPLFASPPAGTEPPTLLHGETVLLDLSQPIESLRNAVRSGHRYEIRRLVASGFEVAWDAWQHYSRFQELYLETMRRVGAGKSYCFSAGYFEELRSLLGPALHLGCVVSPSGEVASASLFTEVNGIVQYHLSATADAFHRLAPSKLLLDRARDWALERGNRWFHLGGGLGGAADALFQFKAGFSKERSRFSTSRLVIDAERHEMLLQRWSQFHSSSNPASSFFPRYRQAA